MFSLRKTLSDLSFPASDPLFSTIITLFTLVLLYFPSLFVGIVFAPVPISAGILLFVFLRLGAARRIDGEREISCSRDKPPATHDLTSRDLNWVAGESESEAEIELDLGIVFDREYNCAGDFAEWNVGAPLEVIQEGEEDEKDAVWEENKGPKLMTINRYPSLSLYYPESDSDSSSDGEFPVFAGWESPKNMGFRWEEDDRDGLIEIALDCKRENKSCFHIEEDNMIEIDISPARNQ